MSQRPPLRTTLWLALRSLAWAVVLPGIFAGFLPWRYFGLRSADISLANPFHWIALLAILLGAILLAVAIVEFARTGRGTLSPLDPPRMLVVRGLYRYVRNPMYLSVTVLVLGEALLAGSTPLLFYWVIWFGAANLFVMGYEEPNLRSRFGARYDRYAAAVGRWIPRLKPYRPTE
ncbi:MAG: methyltransferase family protein [Gemmatimonadales bacterium]